MKAGPLFLAAFLAAPVAAQVHGARTDAGCLKVGGPVSNLSARGLLSIQTFPGPPNYEDVAKGDRPEKTFVLRLPGPICIDDGGRFADPAKSFSQIQISYRDRAIFKLLETFVGYPVTVSGAAEPAMTGAYHLPMAIFVDRVSDASGRSRSR